MKKLSLVTVGLCALGISSLSAQSLKLSIGIRETGGSGPAFANAGTAGGIEWVNKDGQSLVLDGSWQLFTFMPSIDTLSAFAGATANGVLDTDWVSLEHIRILNSDGLTAPIRLWVDDVSNSDSSGMVTQGFETFGIGTEVMFQEPGNSGSTSGNLLGASSSLVTSADAFTGTQSDQIDFQFLDNLATRWVRVTTFNTGNLPNPAMHVRESIAPGALPDGLTQEIVVVPTISFYAKGILVPEPGSLTIGLVGMGICAWIKRRKAA